MSNKQLKVSAWAISVAASTIAVIAWGQTYDWQLANLTIYQWFLLFGLLAFSLMWSHYIAAALRSQVGADKAVLKSDFEATSGLVLMAILLHPGLLGYQLWRDGLGLPPGSYKAYIGTTLYIWILVGLLAWITFMAYELRRKFADRNWWKYVELANRLAMVLIFLHALKLGSHLNSGWFVYVWYFYGLTLVLSWFYIDSLKRKHKN